MLIKKWSWTATDMRMRKAIRPKAAQEALWDAGSVVITKWPAVLPSTVSGSSSIILDVKGLRHQAPIQGGQPENPSPIGQQTYRQVSQNRLFPT